MLELMYAGGWLMWPIVACSVIATAVIVERAFVLRRSRIMPADLIARIWQLHARRELTAAHIEEIRAGSPLGRMLSAGLVNRNHSREVMKEAIADAGRHAIAELERHLGALATIASVAPLLGLLGTVFGMIDIFGVIVESGTGNAGVLAGGISKALVTTAAGLSVAIPALLFYRYFDGRVARIAIDMEEQALHLVEVMKGQREESEELA